MFFLNNCGIKSNALFSPLCLACTVKTFPSTIKSNPFDVVQQAIFYPLHSPGYIPLLSTCTLCDNTSHTHCLSGFSDPFLELKLVGIVAVVLLTEKQAYL